MIKATILSICFFLLTIPVFAQQIIDGCLLQPYTKCPEVNLSNANLEGVNLKGAYLKGANLKHTILRNANLIDVYLYEADLTGADLTGADLSKAIWPDGRVCAFGSIGQCN
jgi:uncharacterized protein YjbI with pentapeptide repeats